MRRRFFLFLAFVITVLSLSSCGVGSYSVSSGREDVAGLSFTDKTKHDIVVNVDGEDYHIQTVKTKAFKPGMNIKKTANNTIRIEPGQHNVVVKSGEAILFSKRIFVSTGENKVINL